MSAEKYSTIWQHEQIRVPEGWSQQERMLVTQMNNIFTDIYKRFGRMGVKYLEASLREPLATLAEPEEITVVPETSNWTDTDDTKCYRTGSLVVCHVSAKYAGMFTTYQFGENFPAPKTKTWFPLMSSKNDTPSLIWGYIEEGKLNFSMTVSANTYIFGTFSYLAT